MDHRSQAKDQMSEPDHVSTLHTPSLVSVLAWRIPGTTEPGGLRLWGHTGSDTTETTWRRQQQPCLTLTEPVNPTVLKSDAQPQSSAEPRAPHRTRGCPGPSPPLTPAALISLLQRCITPTCMGALQPVGPSVASGPAGA